MTFTLTKVRMPWSPRDRSGTQELDAEAEIARNLWKNYYLLVPMSPRRNLWDWVLVLMVFFNSLEIPFVLVFALPNGAQEGIRMFDYVLDGFFWVDILLNLNTSYYVDEQLVTSRRAILQHYAFPWMLIDLCATIPWDEFSRGNPDADITQGNMRALRILRLLRLKRVVIKLDSLKGGVILRFFTLLVSWFLIAHWFACIWWFIGRSGYEDAHERLQIDPFDRSNETSWLVRIPPIGISPLFSKEAFDECVASCVASCGNGCTQISCMANSTCDDNNLNPELSAIPELWDEVFNQWLTSLYWALTMLMKMPNVGPDTTLEKGFSCITVIVGAIFFALLLGQVTTLIMVTAKAGTQLRDKLVEMTTFATSRRVPGRLSNTIQKYHRAEWTVTKGMDTQTLLQDFPTQLKGDVLAAVFEPLIECNPPFLRCSEQLRRQILGLLRPSVALKKQTIVAGRQFGATIYVLMKGALQVSQASAEDDKKGGGSEASPGMGRRGVSMGAKDLKKQLTRMNTKGFKDKLQVRMLEKPGAVIPLDTIFEGPRTSLLSVFAVAQSQLLLIEAPELARLLDAYPQEDANIVTAALENEYKNLLKSLKMNMDGTSVRVESPSCRASGADPQPSSPNLPLPSTRTQKAEAATMAEKVGAMEVHAKSMIQKVNDLQQQTAKVPLVWKALAEKLGVPLDPNGGESPSPTLSESGGGGGGGGGGSGGGSPSKKDGAGGASGVAGFFGLGTHRSDNGDEAAASSEQ